jgi:MFS family permease
LSAGTRRAAGLGALFGALAFLQTIAEPTDGLAAQPIRALLTRQGHGTGQVGVFVALIALPWAFKPVYGLLTDAVPLWGRRRQGYLVASGGLAALALLALAARPSSSVGVGWMLAGLAVATSALAFSDVASDALLIDEGRPLGRIGQFQAAQWGSAYAAGVLVGLVGGRWSRDRREDRALLVCGLASVALLALAALAVREPRGRGPRPGLGVALGSWGRALRSQELRSVGGFLFLWNFNPFSTAVLHRHMTGALGLGEAFFGRTQSLMAVASIAACLGYARMAGRVPLPALSRISIGLGVASTMAYWAMEGPRSAVVVSATVGVVYMTATLIQLDLAARACPPEAAGGVFATLMALENLASALATALGGWCYEAWSGPWGEEAAFRLLVGLGAATTAASWLLLPSARPAEVVPGPA